MKNILFLVLLCVGCSKAVTVPPIVHTGNFVPSNADTMTIFITAAYRNPYTSSLMYWMFKDSVLKHNDSVGGYIYLSQFRAVDSLQGNFRGDSEIGYVFYNHSWVRLPSYPSSGLWGDSLYCSYGGWGDTGTSFMVFQWQSNKLNVNTYIKDTMYFKVLVKPN